MNNLFGKLSLDDRVSDCPYSTGVDLQPILERFGDGVTWRTLLNEDRHALYAVPGFGEKTVDKLYAFMSQNVEYSFTDLI